MATRSIKLKLAVGGEANKPLRQAIWTTHKVFNEGVACYMQWLMRMRQRPIEGESASEVDILTLARAAQRANGAIDCPGSDEDIRALLECLYCILVPSAERLDIDNRNLSSDISNLLNVWVASHKKKKEESEEGGPKGKQEADPASKARDIARNYLSPLVSQKSKGGLGLDGRKKSPWQSESEPQNILEGARKWWASNIEQAGVGKSDKQKAAMRILGFMRFDLAIMPIMPAAYVRSKLISEADRNHNGKKQNNHDENNGGEEGCSTWDRDMFQQALERLMSWESWNCRVEKEKKKKEYAWKELKTKYLEAEPDWYCRLRQYEQQRRDLQKGFESDSDMAFCLTERTIRGWNKLREKWLDPRVERTEECLKGIIADLQNEMGGRLGDASDFFPWLAKQANHFLWEKEDLVRQHVIINKAERAKNKAKDAARYTRPDALEHPLWARSEDTGGSNIHKYKLFECDGQLCAEIRLLQEVDQERFIEKVEKIALQPTSQWNKPQRGDAPPMRIVKYDEVSEKERIRVNPNRKDRTKEAGNSKACTWVLFTDPGTRKKFYGTIGGAKLQLDRGDFHLGDPTAERKILKERDYASGDHFPRVYLNLTVDVGAPENPDGVRALKYAAKKEAEPWTIMDYWLPDDPSDGRTNKRYLTEIDCVGAKMTEGLRIMSVDLGVRQLAACSVFELTRSPGGKKFNIPVAGADGLFIEHRRTFLLKLPGEKVTAEIQKARDEIRLRRLIIRAAINRLKQLLSLGRLDDPAKKREEYNALRGQDQYILPERRQKVDEILNPALLDSLEPFIDKPNDPRWPDAVISVHRQWERALGGEIRKWRREGRAAGRLGERRGYGGLSFWHIEELEETRKLLNAWSCHSREYESRPDGTRRPKVVRPKKRFGVKTGEIPDGQDIDARLLAHINRLKEDRLKVGADAIVMAALGYEYKDSVAGWEQKHPPCQMVLFEDLSRYRFKNDRPRRENSMLMKWGHREIPRTVAMQGEVFGLTIGNVAAEFSSKFRASGDSLTPGVRCRQVTSEDLESKWFLDKIKREIEKKHLKETPKEGAMIPWDGGEWFCTLNGDGSLFKINADLNAAQNLMRRFWRRYSGTFRLSCRRATLADGKVVWFPKNLAKRLPRALKYDFGEEAARLVQDDAGKDWFKLEPISLKAYRKLTGEKAANNEDAAETDDELAAAGEELAEMSGEVVTFFRDPSGIILPSDIWLPAKIFWARVHQKIAERLAEKTVSDGLVF